MTVVMPASFTRAQNGSYMVSNGDRCPLAVVGAAGRITITRAPFATAHSSSEQAHSTEAKEMYGPAKMRSA